MFKSFFDPMPRIVAHRGDSARFPENTLEAFLSAYAMGVDVIETDVHLSKDGVLVIWHDRTLDRNTDGSGMIEDHTLAELKQFDAGFSFSHDDGQTYPFRGKGIRLCTLEEALKACPAQRFNIDLKTKSEAIVDVFIQVIRANHATRRVVGASFHLSNLKSLRKKAPEILTSLTTTEVVPLLLLQKLGLLPTLPFKKRLMIFQVPVRQKFITVITPRFIKAMHKRGAIIQVWTINEEKEIRRLFELGVDAVMTDKPTLTFQVARQMGIRDQL